MPLPKKTFSSLVAAFLLNGLFKFLGVILCVGILVSCGRRESPSSFRPRVYPAPDGERDSPTPKDSGEDASPAERLEEGLGTA
jgi:hypothetical protein